MLQTTVQVFNIFQLFHPYETALNSHHRTRLVWHSSRRNIKLPVLHSAENHLGEQVYPFVNGWQTCSPKCLRIRTPHGWSKVTSKCIQQKVNYCNSLSYTGTVSGGEFLLSEHHQCPQTGSLWFPLNNFRDCINKLSQASHKYISLYS